MAENSKSLIDLKKESEELNNSIHALLDEAVSYKNATGSLLHVTETLHAASTNMFDLSNKATTVISTLEDLNPDEIHEIRSDMQHLVDRNKSIMDRLEAIEKKQKDNCEIISEALEMQEKETNEIRTDIQHLIDHNKSIMDRLEAIEKKQKIDSETISEALKKQKEETLESIETKGKKIVVFGVVSFILLIVILVKVIIL